MKQILAVEVEIPEFPCSAGCGTVHRATAEVKRSRDPLNLLSVKYTDADLPPTWYQLYLPDGEKHPRGRDGSGWLIFCPACGPKLLAAIDGLR